jgi:5-formyltetrahydrofolate cyclo-ligase
LIPQFAVTAPLNQDKASLRQQIRARLDSLPAAQRHSASSRLCAQLRRQTVWSVTNSVLLFAPLPDEPDLWPLVLEAIATGKTVALPGFDSGTNGYVARHIVDPIHEIKIGRFGVREPAVSCAPVPLNRLDLVLVPGVAFDLSGGRLGRGKGFYDRLLSAVNGTKCGAAFDEQILNAVPVGPMDIRLDCILTPTRWIET